MNPVFLSMLALGLTAGAAAALLIWRARKPLALPALCCKPDAAATEIPATGCGWCQRMRSTLAYLRTRREWRYRTPWVLMLGEDGAGKSSLPASVSAAHRLPPDARQRSLAADGAGWRFFAPGVLIDADSGLPGAALGSPQYRRWSALLDQLDALRPERPIDGVLLSVSARTLRDAGRERQLEIARIVNRQLQDIRQRFEFSLPVYVVVTQTDAIVGFSAFWNSQPAQRLSELFGWSAPQRDNGDAPAQWADSAFETVGDRLRALQTESAAFSDTIADADRFFLFPRHLQQLRVPLRQWLEVVFQPSAWHAGFFCRGIYFTGSTVAGGALAGAPREDVAFVDDLVLGKVLAEPRLAIPTRQGRWSRNRLLRSLQAGALALLAGVLVALAVAGFQLQRQVDALIAALHQVQQDAAVQPIDGECLAQPAVSHLIARIAAVDADLRYAAIPVSWFDYHAAGATAERIANTALQQVVLPALSCRLALRAAQLQADRPNAVATGTGDAGSADGANAGYLQARFALFDFVQKVQALELNLRRFERLGGIGAAADRAALTADFNALVVYAYGPAATPAGDRHGTLAAALRQVKYAVAPVLPANMRQGFAARIKLSAGVLRTALDREVAAGKSLISQLDKEQEPLLTGIHHLAWWLSWTRQSWVGSTDILNPCSGIQNDLAQRLTALSQNGGYPQTLAADASARFGPQACYRPSIDLLAGLQLAPYGTLFTRQDASQGGQDGKTLAMNPRLQVELNGLNALLALGYMQVEPTLPFVCLGSVAGWQAADIGQATGFARDYQQFAAGQGLPPLGADAAQRPLFDRLARAQLERVMNSTLRGAQQMSRNGSLYAGSLATSTTPTSATPTPASSAAAPIPAAGGQPAQSLNTTLDAASQADQELSQQSTDFATSSQALLGLLRLYQQLGFAASAPRITQCVRNFATDSLGRIQILAGISRLYEPTADTVASPAAGATASAAAAADGGIPLYNLGSTPVIKDYLARQVSRSQVLAGYASPFLSFLQNSSALNDAQRSNSQSTAYWSGTIGELNRYVQFKEPNGQVAQLDTLFLKQFPELTAGNCSKTLAGYQPAEYGNDLFSVRRQQVEDATRWRCKGGRYAQAYSDYQLLSVRFNADLAGRYPFADLGAGDASPDTVKAFFAYYATQAAPLRQTLTGLTGDYWNAARDFLTQLDAAAAFFNGTLNSADPAHAGLSQPVKLTVLFRAMPGASPGSEQVLNWNLTSGANSTGYPNRANTLDWPYGQPLVFDVAWASGSLWRPAADRQQPDLQVDGASATFAASGDWALLRMLDQHRPKSGAATDALDPTRSLLEFNIPVTGSVAQPGKTATGSTRLYLGFNLTGKDPKTQAAVALKYPAAFPHAAP